jgi:hypothetical protein
MFLQKQTFNIQDRLFRVNIVTTTTLPQRTESSLSASRGFAIEDGEVNRIAWPRPNETVADRCIFLVAQKLPSRRFRPEQEHCTRLQIFDSKQQAVEPGI